MATFETDKLTYHGYFPAYVRIAAELGPAARVCELGVYNGESLRMFQALFPLAEILGVDYSPGSTWPDGTKGIVCNQDDPILPGLLGGQFGLIVDDASHDGVKTRASFDLLWPLVQPGGYYVIEDWTVALRDDPHWGPQSNWGDSMLRTAESFLPLLAYRDGEASSVTYQYGLIIIRKNAMRAAGGDSRFAVLDADDRALFFAEMRAALDLAEASGDPGPAERCLHAWQVTGEALSGPARRAILTGTGDDDYEEVPRP